MICDLPMILFDADKVENGEILEARFARQGDRGTRGARTKETFQAAGMLLLNFVLPSVIMRKLDRLEAARQVRNGSLKVILRCVRCWHVAPALYGAPIRFFGQTAGR